MKAGSRLTLTSETFGGVPAERGTLRVPIRHAEPGGVALELRFVRLAGAPDGVPLVFLTGGPGLSGIRAGAGRLFPMFDALRAHGDVILFDQRVCVAGEMVTSDHGVYISYNGLRTRDDCLGEIRKSVRRGAKQLVERGIPVDALNSNESADDVAMLARELYGSRARMTLLGWSYGSHLAMAVMKRHDAIVTRAVLAAPEGPDHTYKRPRAIQEHLERLATRSGKDLVGMLSRALDRLDGDPPQIYLMSDDPHVLAEPLIVRLGRFDLEWIASEGLADTRVMQILPDALERMSRGDFQIIGENRLLRGALHALHVEVPLGVARYAMDCASGATAERRALIEREAGATLLGNTIDFPTPDVCDAVGCPDLGDEFRSPPRSETPTLFITGTLDCRTPAENVAELVPGLPNHEHLVVEDAGHGDLLLAGGVQRAIKAFVREQRLESSTIAADVPLQFDAA